MEEKCNCGSRRTRPVGGTTIRQPRPVVKPRPKR